MNQITGASQTTGSTTQQGLPSASFDRLDRLDNGFSPAIPGQTRAEWLEQARTSSNPDMRAFYNELVTLAGGRKDDAALNQVLDRYQALQNAASPGATASEVQAAKRGWLDQIMTMLSRFDPLNNLLNAVQPHLADMTRAAGLGETAWGASLQRVLDAPGSAAAFNDGLRAGILAGGQEMIVGTATTVGGLVRHQADTSVLGHVGDWVRSQTGPLPAVLDTMTPSAARGAATSAVLEDMGGKIGTYLGTVANDPARLKTDIANLINAQWDSLKADHAAAAAKGPQDEARWWGETVGRVSFEVAAAVVPVTKGGTVAKVADGIGGAVQAVNTLDGAAAAAVRAADGAGGAAAEGARIAGRTDGAGGAARAGARLTDEAGDAAKAADGPAATGNAAGSTALRPVRETFGKNVAEWTVDAQGRLLSARATLREVFSDLPRSRAERDAQAAAADKGITGDHGGHAIPHRFLGDQGEINLFPQNGVPDGALKNFNGSAFKTLENELADWVQAGGKVDYEVSFKNFDGDRPGVVEIEYRVFDKNGVEVYKNDDRFRNEAGQVFERVSKPFIESRLNGASQ